MAGEVMSTFGGVILPDEKLRILAKLIHYQEVERIKNVPFKSEIERSKYLHDSRETYQGVLDLLDQGRDQLQSHRSRKQQPAPAAEENSGYTTESDSIDEAIRKKIEYVEIALGFGMQGLKNLHLRKEFLGKVRGHADSLVTEINLLQDGTLGIEMVEEEARKLVRKLADFKEMMFKSIVENASPSSRRFSKALKLSGNSFEDLVLKYQIKLARETGQPLLFLGDFENLTVESKIKVYDEILKSSGRGSYLKNKMYDELGNLGNAVTMFTLGLAAWDVYSSDHKLATITKDSIDYWVGGSFIGDAAEAAGAAGAEYLIGVVGLAETAVTAAAVGLVSMVTGFAAVFAIGLFVGWAVDKIFSSGGKSTGGTVVVDENDKEKLPHHIAKTRVYVAPMPDGAVLARQLAYQGAPKTA